MNFQELFKSVSPRLNKIARNYGQRNLLIDKDDLYQEMCIHLWNNFKNGIPPGINKSYIVKGCCFHILNYLRKKKEKAVLLSLEEPLNDDGNTLKDILPDRGESLDSIIDRKITIEDIKNNGFTKREKEVFSFLSTGYTTREIGKKFGISHVMVVKIKKRIIRKWSRK